MPYAVTHFLVPVIFLELYRELFVKDNGKFPVYYVFLGGIGGLIPDLDLAMFYILSFFGYGFDDVHRVFLHNIWVPALFLILGFVFISYKNEWLGERHMKLKNVFFVLSFGSLIHILLDSLFVGEIMFFYPFSLSAIGFNLLYYFPESWQGWILPSIDGGLLIIWMSYLVIKKRIRGFI